MIFPSPLWWFGLSGRVSSFSLTWNLIKSTTLSHSYCHLSRWSCLLGSKEGWRYTVFSLARLIFFDGVEPGWCATLWKTYPSGFWFFGKSAEQANNHNKLPRQNGDDDDVVFFSVSSWLEAGPLNGPVKWTERGQACPLKFLILNKGTSTLILFWVPQRMLLVLLRGCLNCYI